MGLQDHQQNRHQNYRCLDFLVLFAEWAVLLKSCGIDGSSDSSLNTSSDKHFAINDMRRFLKTPLVPGVPRAPEEVRDGLSPCSCSGDVCCGCGGG